MNTVFLISYVLLWAMVLLLAVVNMAVIRIVRDSRAKTKGPSLGIPVGQPLPDFTILNALNGQVVSSLDLRGKPLLALFVDATCPGCLQAAPKVEEFYHSHHGTMEVAIICRAPIEDARSFAVAADLRSVPVYADADASVSLAFDVTLTPFAMFFDKDGVLRDKVSAMQLEDLENRMPLALKRALEAA